MSISECSPTRGRPKDPAKRNSIMDASNSLFLSRGFSHTSMDAVAKEAGVSKLTVYSHFSDKESLFTAAIKSECQNMMPVPIFELDATQSIRSTLTKIALAFLELLHNPDVIELHRLLSGSATHDAKMATLFFEAGPQRNLDAMETLIRAANHEGLLNIANPKQATENFFSLLQGCEHMRVIIGYTPPMTASQMQPHAEQAVDMFLRAYGSDR